jgi:hypothetical protein
MLPPTAAAIIGPLEAAGTGDAPATYGTPLLGDGDGATMIPVGHADGDANKMDPLNRKVDAGVSCAIDRSRQYRSSSLLGCGTH